MGLSDSLRRKAFNLFLHSTGHLNVKSRIVDDLKLFIKYAELHISDNSQSFKVDNFKLIFYTSSEHQQKIVGFLEKAIDLLKKSSFHNLLYGDITVERIGHAFATYQESIDKIKLRYNNNTDYAIGSIIHELGHRYWYKFMNSSERLEYKRQIEPNQVIITPNNRRSIYFIVVGLLGRSKKPEQQKMHLKYQLKSDKMNLYLWLKYKKLTLNELLKTIIDNGWYNDFNSDNEKIKNFIVGNENDIIVKTKNKGFMKILSPTRYGETSVAESFAETFLWYVMDRKLDDNLKKIFLKAIKR